MTDKRSQEEILESILGNVRQESGEETGGDRSVEEIVLEDFRTSVDPQIVNAGWGFEPAKSVEHGKTDQSLLNHVRNGVFVLAQLNDAVRSLDGYTLDEDDLRAAIALFTIHDIHKLDQERDADPQSRFDIPTEEVQQYVETFGLDDVAPDLSPEDFRSCAIDHHDDWTANYDQTTRRFDDLRPFIRVADGFASCDTPEAATDGSVQAAIDRAYLKSDFELRYHVLDDVKGILTNLLNSAISERLASFDYYPLTIYQDGCVYLVPGEADRPTVDQEFVGDIVDQLQVNIRNSHQAYAESSELSGNLATRSQGFYGINDQEFFYAGAETVVGAIVRKAVGDADPEDEPTDSMAVSMAGLERHLPIEIERTRRPVGYARLAYTIKRAFVDPVLKEIDDDRSGLETTCDVFDVPQAVHEGLLSASEDDDLSPTAGGKWEYSYGIGQVLIEDGVMSVEAINDRVTTGLDRLADDWVEIVEEAHAGNLRSELEAYVSDVVSIEGRPMPESDAALSDPFEEYHNTRRGKTCVLCNRGTTSTRKSDLEAPKSLTTLQAGYSNHIPVDAGKPDDLLACLPCQIELSLRETGASRREGGRLFFHLIPDYFYTPLSWRSYDDVLSDFSGESRIELGRLAEAVLWLTGDLEATDVEGFASALFETDSGRQMAETLDQGFDPGSQFGARTLGYYKPEDNETEFQFFGVYVALAVAAYAGLRVYVSESPIPDIRGRDFQTYARIGAGFTQVQDFYGSEISLSDLESRLRAASALIKLGYGAERNDALFAKFLRVTRNQLLPGSRLLKRIAQADDSSDARYLLEEARVLDQETGIDTTTDTSTPTNE
ncbi:CRISPR-associated protein Csc3/Cas10d [Halalkaliarchaeum desulfuricum]|uniref:CRISPR-associated protein Csc3/Cas10d n=1 Tax=Halalkaliarchaeum desulfuricum TaxID=2055893 RepID=A0A343TGH7_9EURY|nr:type I-D CRISPR-associated protein Cas10d/Csc3 [Halalkaliarchaeum desulfuricum]AUX08199.1 CRISPR-associated protein Csc3/Cas10d [Halalkaliarchaeum desulfuricum]